jgi:hypothetical protein
MNNNTLNAKDFYIEHGQISDPGLYAACFDALPQDLPALVESIQGLMLHLHWAERYGITLNQTRQAESNLRTLEERLQKILNLQDTPLTDTRPLSKKTVGTCRDFALFLTSILRQRGIPARARAGFGTYFTPGKFEDHWICEYYHSQEGHWVMVDAQLDSLQREALVIDFNPLDMPRKNFVTGAQAWLRCRAELVDPDLFGIFDYRGLDFVKGNLIRDVLALNKIEILPWDDFMLIKKPFHEMHADEKPLMDRLAQLSSGDDRDFIPLRTLFTANQKLLVPDLFL